MLQEASNEQLMAEWSRGNQRAADILYRRYMTRLTALARSRLSRKLSRRLEPDDIVLSAWRSFFVAVEAKRLSVPDDDDLWPLLATITLRKISRQASRQQAQQRDARRDQSLEGPRELTEILARDPSPEEAAIMVDEVETLMARLEPRERDVVSLRLQGAEQVAIAQSLGISERTVRRILQRVREVFDNQDAGPVNTSDDELSSELTAEITQMPSALDSIIEPTFGESDVLLQRLVGQGGFGRVYQALIKSTSTRVAVKYLKKRFWQDSRAVDSLLRETSRASNLRHPSILHYLGFGKSRRGALFAVMEWIDGGDVVTWSLQQTPTLSERLDCAVSVAKGIACLHANGVIHGDITPTNVLRRLEGSFVISDLGLAQHMHDPRHHHGGTPSYLAPEQVSDAFGPIDERTDVYGLGGLMYFLMTGSPPVTGGSLADVLAEVISSRPPRDLAALNPQIPQSLIDLILACLNKEMIDRPKSIECVLAQLHEVTASLLR